MAEELRQRVARQIEEAFADTPYPGDENIGWGCGSGGAELQKAFRGKHWRDLTLELIMEYYDSIPCTTSDGFRFYLPAWMLATLLHYEAVDVLSEFVVFNLSPPHGTDTMDHFLRHVGKFTVQEETAILSFLEGMNELYPYLTQLDELMLTGNRTLSLAIEFWKNAS